MALNEYGRYANENVDEFGRFILSAVDESATHIPHYLRLPPHLRVELNGIRRCDDAKDKGKTERVQDVKEVNMSPKLNKENVN